MVRPTGEKPGKCRGIQTIGTGRGAFLTPPSNGKSSEPSSAAPVMGARAEGVMPAVNEEVAECGSGARAFS